MNTVCRFYSEDLFIRGAAVISTPVVLDMAGIQQMGPLATLATGRAVTGALLMASVLKDGQMTGVHFRGDGALGGVYAEASFEGEARGWCDNPRADLPLREGHFDIAGGIGAGFLHVTRSQPFEKSPHVSSVHILSGEIGDDLAYYLHQSLQIPCVIAVGASTDEHGVLEASGGVLLELLPGAPDSVVSALEEQVLASRPLRELLKEGVDAEGLIKNFVGSIKMNPIPHNFPIRYTCRCSMDRVERSLTMIGQEALKELADEGKDTEARCEFCGRNYKVTLARIQEMISEMRVKH